MRQSVVSLALALTFALSSSSLTARAAGGGIAYDLPALGPGGGAGIVFADALQQSSGWRSETPAALNLDPGGNVRSLLPGQTAVRTIYTSEAYPAGDYTLLYDGAGVFGVEGGSIVASSAGRATVRVDANAGAGLSLRLISTGSANPVRNVRLILPGYETTYAAQPFVPSYVRSLLGRNVLRFAQWMHADTFVDSMFWTQRPRVTQVTQTMPAGVAPEYMILLANLTGASPWFTLPVGATDGYAYGFATLVHQTLDPRLHPIFQYGNEVWNSATPGNGYAQMAAHNVKIPGNSAAAALSWYTRRSSRVLSLVRAAFGRDASRVTRVISGPAPAATRFFCVRRVGRSTHLRYRQRDRAILRARTRSSLNRISKRWVTLCNPEAPATRRRAARNLSRTRTSSSAPTCPRASSAMDVRNQSQARPSSLPCSRRTCWISAANLASKGPSESRCPRPIWQLKARSIGCNFTTAWPGFARRRRISN